MAAISKGTTFATGDQVTALKLNNLVDNSTFAAGAVDNTSTQLSSGAIIVKDGGVTTAKLNDGGVTTAKIADDNVTTAKIADANVTFAKLTDVIDDDTMATATDTTLATSESIKAYVDNSNLITETTGSAPYYGCRAFASYNGITQTLNNGANIVSVTRNSTGDYTFIFDVAMPDTNYSVVTGGTNAGAPGLSYISVPKIITKTTSSFRIRAGGSGPSGGDVDQSILDVAVFR
jgi:hypothetical protein